MAEPAEVARLIGGGLRKSRLGSPDESPAYPSVPRRLLPDLPELHQ